MRPSDRLPPTTFIGPPCPVGTGLLLGSLLATIALPGAAFAQADATLQNEPPGEQQAKTPDAETPTVAVPDRPSFSTAPYTTPAGHVQLEAGVSTVVDGSDVALGLPTLLARVGIADTFELGFGFPSYQVEFTDADTISGLGDAQLTGKFAIPAGDEAAVGMLPFVTIPVDQDGVDDSVTLGGLFLWQVQANDRIAIFSNIGAFTGPDPNDTGTAFGGVTSVGASFTLSDAWGAYLEGYSFFGSGDGVEPAVDGGFSYAILPWLVADAWAGFGFAESAFLGGLGITMAR